MQVIQIVSFAVRQRTEFLIQQETLLNISKKSNDSLKKRYLNKMINKMEASVRARNQITKLLIAHSQNKVRRRKEKGKYKKKHLLKKFKLLFSEFYFVFN